MTEPGSPAVVNGRVAIVLAAGASTRFGGVPKATLLVEGEPAVRRIVRLARAEGLEPFVVAGPHRAAIEDALGADDAPVLAHSGWERGRTGSLQAGLDACGEPELAVVWPVDHPFAEAMSLRTVLATSESDVMALWVLPTFAGRGGHPIVLKAGTFVAVRALPPDAPLRSLHATFGPQVRRVPVDDPGVVANVDTPEQYARAVAARREARWTGG
jgi:molybdenum cofactor cytidylyltransferase